MAKHKKDFYAGIISALAVVELHHADTIHEEIVALCDKSELIAYARAEEELEWFGLARHAAPPMQTVNLQLNA